MLYACKTTSLKKAVLSLDYRFARCLLQSVRASFLLAGPADWVKTARFNFMATASARSAMRSAAVLTAGVPAQIFCKAALVDRHVQTVRS